MVEEILAAGKGESGCSRSAVSGRVAADCAIRPLSRVVGLKGAFAADRLILSSAARIFKGYRHGVPSALPSLWVKTNTVLDALIYAHNGVSRAT